MKLNSEYKVSPENFPEPLDDIDVSEDIQVAILGGGCFWCIEHVFN